MKKVFIYGPQGSGKTWLAKLITETGDLLSVKTVKKDLEAILNEIDIHVDKNKAAIVFDEIATEDIKNVTTFIEGWALGAKFKGSLILICQRDYELDDSWLKYHCNKPNIDTSSYF